ncbi:hypothetical protein [Rhodopseudomonas pseudopalustris]|uniref:Uncharacterized protein n=1 Tax=Rhodopseudomonas pseudopalustris TaxID=1513892 RepID=A0A1H8XBB5_9BRAD|nr:hypothetical protein [Rhodopseudomonas pseudopalustris]SEP37245.1 hypothetical protein SAMN05444123_11916 [Rhodopseudomonas pseudopalustris]
MDLGQRGGASIVSRRPEAAKRYAVVDDDNWQRITEAANAAYVRNDLHRAHELYREALDEAEWLFARAWASGTSGMSVPVPVIYNISCHNLAEIAERSDSLADAECFLVRAYDKLLASAASAETPLALRLDCTRHLKHALAMLVQHLKRRRVSNAQIESYVDRAKTTALTVFHVAKKAQIADHYCSSHSTSRPS